MAVACCGGVISGAHCTCGRVLKGLHWLLLVLASQSHVWGLNCSWYLMLCLHRALHSVLCKPLHPPPSWHPPSAPPMFSRKEATVYGWHQQQKSS